MAYEDPEKHKERVRKWAASEKGKEQRRASELKRKFGLTIEDWNKMFEAQEGKCDICKVHQSELPRRLCVDHNHITGKVRKLLCNDCNTGMGLLKDNPELLEQAIKYLKENA